MPRGFKGPDDSFTVTAAMPNRPVTGRVDDLDDNVATTAFAEPPVKLARLGSDRPPRREPRDRESLTLTIASPLSSPGHSSHSSRPPGGYGAPAPLMSPPRVAARYILSNPIGTGGMATVHLGVRTDGDRRIYAIKRLHEQFAHDDYFAQMLLDEAAIASRIRHENVVTMYGAGVVGQDLILVMEYVSGLTVADLIKQVHPQKLAPRLLTAIFSGALRGLHAAHEAFDEHGRSLDIVHRDVSPQNIHLGADGVARVLDFGIAKAEHRSQTTRAGELKGKTAYMAPEQLKGTQLDRRVDIRAAAVVLWEALTGGPLFHAENEAATMARVLAGCSTPPSELADGVPPDLDDIVMRALSMRPEDRFDTALEMAEALDAVFADDTPPTHEIAAWLTAVAADTICEQWDIRATLLRDLQPAAPREFRPQAQPGTWEQDQHGPWDQQGTPSRHAPQAQRGAPGTQAPRSHAPPAYEPFETPGDRHAETSRLATRRPPPLRPARSLAQDQEGIVERVQRLLTEKPGSVRTAVLVVVAIAVVFVAMTMGR